LHMAQLMPLPLTVSCFSKLQICFTFLVPAHLGSPGKRAVKRVCVCVVKEFDGNHELGRALHDPTLRADNWIVMTTIRSPTDAIRTLAKQPGWKVVVVADKMTPKTWRCALLSAFVVLELAAWRSG